MVRWAGTCPPEEAFADAVDVGRSVFIDRLFVHGLPPGPCLDARLVEDDTHGLHVGVGFAVGVGALGGMHHACRATHRTLYNGLIGVFLSFDT